MKSAKSWVGREHEPVFTQFTDTVSSRRGPWGLAKQRELHRARNNAIPRPVRLSPAIGSCGKVAAAFNRRIAENRTSSGVGECRAQSPALALIQELCLTSESDL
jgi:hypothetical protein